MKNTKDKLVMSFGALVIIAIIGFIFIGIAGHFNTKTITGTVTEKERIIDSGGGSSYYLVWVESKDGTTHVLKNSDTCFRWKFNSSTIHGKIKVGNQVNLRTYGFRIPILSMYPNIIEIE